MFKPACTCYLIFALTVHVKTRIGEGRFNFHHRTKEQRGLKKGNWHDTALSDSALGAQEGEFSMLEKLKNISIYLSLKRNKSFA